jgi:3-dehydroquinate synthase
MTALDHPAPTIVNVDLAGRPYDIAIGRGILAELGPRLSALRPGAAAAIVTDANVAEKHLAAATQSLDRAGIKSSSIVIAPGEKSKSIAGFEDVCDRILATRLDRNDIVVALGGGVVGDLAGFAAAAVRRGVDYVQVPTSLLAQVDSSVGGKTGINSRHGKNLIGAFHQPILVLADTAVLDTLPLREFQAGYAEVAKYGLIDDAKFFNWLEVNWKGLFAGDLAREEAVAICCRAKAAIVARDEKENGDRALLNLGHTFGHALEAGAGFSGRLLHGEAVAIGMVQAFDFSVELGLANGQDAERVRRHLAAVGLRTRADQIDGEMPDVDGLMDLIAQDKKVQRGKLTFILTRGIGESFIAKDVDPAKVREFLARQR